MKQLIIKYLTDSLTDDEMEQLILWLKKPKNQKTFQTFIKDNYAINVVYDAINDEDALLHVKKRIQNLEKPARQLYWRYAAAAVVVGILATAYFFKDTIFTNNNDQPTTVSHPVIVNNQIEPGTDKATLTLADGSVVALEKGTSYQTQNASSNGEEIVYLQGAKSQEQRTETNTLTIPRGGQFMMTLSDGTKVWLNSETQIKYPVSFTDGESRQVDLVYGEAYFEVSPSTEHQGSDFKVMHNQQTVEVLGTQFNIKAYKDETNIYTTLAEGKVSVSVAGHQLTLSPGEQANVNTLNNQMTVAMVNVNNIISWKDGIFDFKDMPLQDIMRTLSRWYDMDVQFDGQVLQQEHFNGRLKKQYSIVEILETIKASNIITTYEINERNVVLK